MILNAEWELVLAQTPCPECGGTLTHADDGALCTCCQIQFQRDGNLLLCGSCGIPVGLDHTEGCDRKS